jgi:Fic family protein
MGKDDERVRPQRAAPALNERQLELVLYALRHPEAEFTTNSHQRAHGLDDQMARADLQGLMELGYLTRRRIGRAFVFYPVPDMGQRLAGLI